jgi:hypothetical protein
MSTIVVLDGIELIPVLEMEPFKFAKQTRELPSGTSREVPDEWFHYWSDSLADSGITDLHPLCRGSWHVPTANFDGSGNLQRFLDKTFQDWGGIDSLSDPDCEPVLNGGLALRCSSSDVLIEPGCCADLGDACNWKEPAGYRGAEWKMLWIGHPWLSFRYREPWLVLSERHESNDPVERWAVSPDELNRALDNAMIGLERFAGELARLLPLLGHRGDPVKMAHKLAGLEK